MRKYLILLVVILGLIIGQYESGQCRLTESEKEKIRCGAECAKDIAPCRSFCDSIPKDTPLNNVIWVTAAKVCYDKYNKCVRACR